MTNNNSIVHHSYLRHPRKKTFSRKNARSTCKWSNNDHSASGSFAQNGQEGLCDPDRSQSVHLKHFPVRFQRAPLDLGHSRHPRVVHNRL